MKLNVRTNLKKFVDVLLRVFSHPDFIDVFEMRPCPSKQNNKIENLFKIQKSSRLLKSEEHFQGFQEPLTFITLTFLTLTFITLTFITLTFLGRKMK